MQKQTLPWFLWLLCVVLISEAWSQSAPSVNPAIQVRSGFELTVAVDGLERARFMELDEQGTLYVSQPHLGSVQACRDRDGDGVFETITPFIQGHRTVHGLEWHEGWLWFSETGAIFKARDTDGDGQADEEVVVIPTGQLPSGGGHWWRALMIHQGRLYTSIGCSGNITEEAKSERMKIWSY